MDAGQTSQQSSSKYRPCRQCVRTAFAAWIGAGLWFSFIAGCVAHRGQSMVELPGRHSVRAERLVIHSDTPLDEQSPLVTELAELRTDILAALALNEPRRPVIVYLFDDESRYSEYMRRHFPKLPTRRAFFIGSTTELAVYAYQGDHLATDLRHEYTHGVLHACLRNVPLWLDEGLAEYFEPPRGMHHVNEEHVERLQVALAGGWTPDLTRLEQLSDVSEMQALDYHEAWAWVYLGLKGPDDDRKRLVAYIGGLTSPSAPERLSKTWTISQMDARSRISDQLDLLAPASAAEGRAAVEQVKFEDPPKVSQ